MMHSMALAFVPLVVVFTLFNPAKSAPELLQNPGFEHDTSHWDCWGYNCDVTSDSHSGSKALNVTGRTMYYQGPNQAVTMGQGKRYSIEGWIKLLNHNNKILQYIEIEVALTMANDHKDYKSVARRPFLTPDDGWVHLAGDFVTPTSGISTASIYLQGPDPGINFVVDDMSLMEIPENTNWKTEANQRIEKIRKSDITFHVTTASGISPSSVQLEINQISNGFPFGTEVNARDLVSTTGSNRKYQKFLYENFNWGVLGNALKWYEFENNKGHPNWDWGEKAVKELVKNGMNVRAHNMLWAVEQYVPGWLKNMSPAQVRQEVAKHVKDTTLRYKGLVKHWDVNNELLHGNWYETKLNDSNYTKDIFRMIHQWDPTVKLFLNEYNTVGAGGTTQAYSQQGADYKKSHTYIHGLGVQTHFPANIAPDPTLMLRRLDSLQQAGLPLWATEVDVKTNDEHQRADWYETAYRVLFSHPAVQGIVMWGFWSEAHYAGEKASLVSGQEFRTNAAGTRYMNLIKNEWRTNATHVLSSGSDFTVRGFRGDYEVKVNVNGKVTKTQHFTLGKNTQPVTIAVTN